MTTTAPAAAVDPAGNSAIVGAVVGPPRRWLRVEAATLAIASLIAYSSTGVTWWLVPATLLVPDLSMLGYLAGTRIGASLLQRRPRDPAAGRPPWVWLVAAPARYPGFGSGLARPHRPGPALGLRPQVRRPLPPHPPRRTPRGVRGSPHRVSQGSARPLLKPRKPSVPPTGPPFIHVFTLAVPESTTTSTCGSRPTTGRGSATGCDDRGLRRHYGDGADVEPNRRPVRHQPARDARTDRDPPLGTGHQNLPCQHPATVHVQ